MGIIINKSAILCSGFAVLGIMLGLNPYFAFVLSILSFIPVRIILGGKFFSQTGAFASFGAVAGMTYLGFSPFQAFLLGTCTGYIFLYFWILVVPKLLKDKNQIKV